MAGSSTPKGAVVQLLVAIVFPGLVFLQMSSPAAAACAWRIVDSPPIHGMAGSRLMGVVALNASDSWAVGAATSAGGAHRTLTEHWNGSAWKVVPSPNASSGDNGFNGVTALASNNVWAVGYALNRQNFTTLVEHWNGSSWSIVASPRPGSTSSLIGAAHSGSDVWAVGTSTDSSGVRPLIERWNGTAWSRVPSDPADVADSGLVGVAAASDDDVWAAGWQSSSAGLQPLIERWGGGAWHRVPAASPGLPAALTGITAGAGGTWTVGFTYDGYTYRPITEQWDGSSWSVEPTPPVSPHFGVFRGVAALASSDAWAVGGDSGAGRVLHTLGEHWDGSDWSIVSTPARGVGDNELNGLAAVPGTSQLWAVGKQGKQPLVEGYCVSATAVAGGPAGSAAVTNGATHSVPRVPDHAATGGPPPASPRRPPLSAAEPTAKDKAAAAGIYEITETFAGSIVADFNGDGWPDLFLNRFTDSPRLYVNDQNGRFTQIDSFHSEDRHGCDAADVNHDGRLDILCAIGAGRGIATKSNDLQLQQPNGDFSDGTLEAGLTDPFGRGRQIAFLDVNHDGYSDAFIGNEDTRADGLPTVNKLFINQKDGTFRDEPSFGLDRQLGADSTRAIDYNDDGWMDLLLCTPGGLHLYRNDGGTGFTDVSNSMGLGSDQPADAWIAPMGDALPELVEVTTSQLTVKAQSGGNFVTVYQRQLTSGAWLALGDANGDGLLDIYVVQRDKANPDLVLLNMGGGTSFSKLPIPQAPSGIGDAAYPIDYDRNGLTDFVVQNGHLVKGQIQLIAFFP